ncbi:polysaccharide biosynthesis C-terminal domain-containing protein, partial [Bacillus sp. JJ1503]|uniref:oligosaccharide flippase family protein n=1 Tax=Bacillus sp. JJ1503 TaxID=3122956 RepID=UPI002FFFDEE0
IYAMQFFTGIVSICIYLIFIIFFIDENNLILLLHLFFIISAQFDINWFFFGLEKFKITIIRNIIIKIIVLVSIFLFVRTSNDLWIYTLIMSFGTFLSQSAVWVLVKKHVSFVKPSLKEIKKHIKPNLVLFVPVIAYSIYKVMDKIMIGSMVGMSQLGLYENAGKLISIPLGILIAVGTVMLPRMSNLVANNKNSELRIYIEKSMMFISIITYPILFGISAISTILAPVFFGSEFRESGPLITYMSPTILLIAWSNIVRTQYLIPKNKNKVYIISTICGALVNLVLNLMLIPSLFALGAVIATIAAEATVTIIIFISVRRKLNICKYVISNFKYGIFGLIMYFPVRFLGDIMGEQISTLFYQIITGFVVYGTCILLYVIISRDEQLYPLFCKLFNTINKRIQKI